MQHITQTRINFEIEVAVRVCNKLIRRWPVTYTRNNSLFYRTVHIFYEPERRVMKTERVETSGNLKFIVTYKNGISGLANNKRLIYRTVLAMKFPFRNFKFHGSKIKRNRSLARNSREKGGLNTYACKVKRDKR